MPSATEVKEFRRRTGLPIMECKELLDKANGNVDIAQELARKKGLKPDNRPLDQQPGYIGIYRHHNGQFVAVVDLRCASEALAHTEEFKKLADDLALHVSVAKPAYIRRDDITEPIKYAITVEIVNESEKQLAGKPEEINQQIVNGKLEAKLKQICLVEQPYIKDPKMSVAVMIDALALQAREPIIVQQLQYFSI